jgi:preprotein translocase subunit SecD
VAQPTATPRPGRSLIAIGLLVVLVFGLIWAVAPNRLGEDRLTTQEKFTPRLGLDLEGGTSIILTPRVAPGQQGTITQDALDRAVEIIRSRVDSFGVAEAEVTTASDNIVISVPGTRDQSILDTVRQTAQLRFRQVLLSGAPGPAPESQPTDAPSPTTSADEDGATTTDGRAVPEALQQAGTESPGSPGSPGAEDPTGTGGGAQPDSGLSAEVTPELQRQFAELDCTDIQAVRDRLRRPGADATGKAIVTCQDDGSAKYVLGPAEVLGTDVKSASAQLETDNQGNPIGGSWQVILDFTGEGTRKFAEVTRRLSVQQGDPNRFGIVLDGLVVSAPSTESAITGGNAQITGDFTQQEATDLANVLKYGALPLTFDPGEVQEVSATLGGDQLDAGLAAGAIGLLLVLGYSLLYYRGLGLVTAASLLVAGVLTYGMVVLLGWQLGFRLSLAGIAGLIVAIGITADSFVVFFERLRDEVRDGRSLRVAVETGWRRARRTILAADFVSFLAASVLYLLSVGGVRGFAFTLGLTTLIDVFVVFLFTKPLVSLLVRTRFYGSGHKLSGLDAGHMGGPRRTLLTGAGRRREGATAATRSGPPSAPTVKEA